MFIRLEMGVDIGRCYQLGSRAFVLRKLSPVPEDIVIPNNNTSRNKCTSQYC
jgi:hypothetical protein